MNTDIATPQKQKLGLFALTALVAGNMIGSGIFLLPSNLARVGSISLLAWVFTAIGAFFLALVFSKMSSINPKAGGPFNYVEANLGEFMGFQTAYTYWIAVCVGNAAVVTALIGYLHVFFPKLSNPTISSITGVCIVYFLTLINMKGVRYAGAVQVATTIFKLLPLLFIALLGWGYFHPEFITKSFNVTSRPHFAAFAEAASLTMWAFLGVESATIPAGSVNNPRRNIPLATLFGTLIAAVVYIAISTAVMGMIPAKELVNSTSPFAAAAKIIVGAWGEWLIAAGAVISCFGGLNGWILVQSQVAMAAADHHLFPHLFAKRNKADVPVWGLIISSTLMCLVLVLSNDPNLVDQFKVLIDVAVAATLIAYFYTAAAEVIWITRHGGDHKLNKVNVIISLLACGYSALALFGTGQNIVFYIMMLMFSSLPLYSLVVWAKKRRTDVLG
jgi:basic amino acid/polyamine antiporter, APA family